MLREMLLLLISLILQGLLQSDQQNCIRQDGNQPQVLVGRVLPRPQGRLRPVLLSMTQIWPFLALHHHGLHLLSSS